MPSPYLTLNALLGPRVRLSSELKGKLSVNPEELIETFNYGVGPEFLPALMVALGIVKPEDGIKLCEKFNDEGCVDFVLAVKGNSAAVKQLREWLINAFRELLFKIWTCLRSSVLMLMYCLMSLWSWCMGLMASP